MGGCPTGKAVVAQLKDGEVGPGGGQLVGQRASHGVVPGCEEPQAAQVGPCSQWQRACMPACIVALGQLWQTDVSSIIASEPSVLCDQGYASRQLWEMLR